MAFIVSTATNKFLTALNHSSMFLSGHFGVIFNLVNSAGRPSNNTHIHELASGKVAIAGCGVIRGYKQGLRTTISGSNLTVNTGAALVGGVLVDNEASWVIPLTTAVEGVNYVHIVINKSTNTVTYKLATVPTFGVGNSSDPSLTGDTYLPIAIINRTGSTYIQYFMAHTDDANANQYVAQMNNGMAAYHSMSYTKDTATTIRAEFKAVDDAIKAEFRAADTTLQNNINTINTNLSNRVTVVENDIVDLKNKDIEQDDRILNLEQFGGGDAGEALAELRRCLDLHESNFGATIALHNTTFVDKAFTGIDNLLTSIESVLENKRRLYDVITGTEFPLATTVLQAACESSSTIYIIEMQRGVFNDSTQLGGSRVTVINFNTGVRWEGVKKINSTEWLFKCIERGALRRTMTSGTVVSGMTFDTALPFNNNVFTTDMHQSGISNFTATETKFFRSGLCKVDGLIVLTRNTSSIGDIEARIYVDTVNYYLAFRNTYNITATSGTYITIPISMTVPVTTAPAFLMSVKIGTTMTGSVTVSGWSHLTFELIGR